MSRVLTETELVKRSHRFNPGDRVIMPGWLFHRCIEAVVGRRYVLTNGDTLSIADVDSAAKPVER